MGAAAGLEGRQASAAGAALFAELERRAAAAGEASNRDDYLDSTTGEWDVAGLRSDLQLLETDDAVVRG